MKNDEIDKIVDNLFHMIDMFNQGEDIEVIFAQFDEEYEEKVKSKLEDPNRIEMVPPFKPYDDYISLIKDLLEKYKRLNRKELKRIKESASFIECDNGKFSLDRGYYSPSIFQDAITGGIGKRKLLKRKNINKKQYHEYFFDERKKMRCITTYFEGFGEYYDEIIINLNDFVIGIMYDYRDSLVNYITISKYDGSKIIETAQFGIGEDKISIEFVEHYEYLEREVIVYHSTQANYKRFQRYVFQLEENTMISFDEENFYKNVLIRKHERFYLTRNKQMNISEFEEKINAAYC